MCFGVGAVTDAAAVDGGGNEEDNDSFSFVVKYLLVSANACLLLALDARRLPNILHINDTDLDMIIMLRFSFLIRLAFYI